MSPSFRKVLLLLHSQGLQGKLETISHGVPFLGLLTQNLTQNAFYTKEQISTWKGGLKTIPVCRMVCR